MTGFQGFWNDFSEVGINFGRDFRGGGRDGRGEGGWWGGGVGREVDKPPLVYIGTSNCDQKRPQPQQTAKEPSVQQ